MAHRSRGLVRKPSPQNSALLLRDSHKPREPLRQECSKHGNTPQLGLALFTAQLHQTSKELKKSHYFFPQENRLRDLEENRPMSDSCQVLFFKTSIFILFFFSPSNFHRPKISSSAKFSMSVSYGLPRAQDMQTLLRVGFMDTSSSVEMLKNLLYFSFT